MAEAATLETDEGAGEALESDNDEETALDDAEGIALADAEATSTASAPGVGTAEEDAEATEDDAEETENDAEGTEESVAEEEDAVCETEPVDDTGSTCAARTEGLEVEAGVDDDAPTLAVTVVVIVSVAT